MGGVLFNVTTGPGSSATFEARVFAGRPPVDLRAEVAILGPVGPQGQPGKDALSPPILVAFEELALIDGEQTITLPLPVAAGWFLLCVNGVRQAVTSYSVSGVELSLPSDLNVLAGDLISLDFYTPHPS